MTKLQREAIVRAALELVNEVGMDGLTTRRLAERLGVEQPALYWHFKNKRALLDAVAQAMLAGRQACLLPGPGEDWRVFLREYARSFRRVLLACRDGARIYAGTRQSGLQMYTRQAQCDFLCAEGFAPAVAACALQTIGRYVVGAVLDEQAIEAARPAAANEGPDHHPALAAAAQENFAQAEPDTAFERGLAIFLDGLAVSSDSNTR